MKHLVIGTAGHVDHGKTVLVEKLTGTNTDRLQQEKDRGISIELGFTFMTLNDGELAGIVDVPGHERFIKNMLAGVGGIDMVMLVIAADEGVMPQTREHMDIIELLQIQKGIVVITKTDLVDEELLQLAEEDVQEYIAQTSLAGAPLVKVSAFTGEGLDRLRSELTEIAQSIPSRPETGTPRLPVDRCFSVTGFGTVVTGTLVSGRLEVGASVEVYPQRLPSRVRSLQVHGEKKEYAGAGQRVAVNLTGIETGSIERGNVIAPPGVLQPWNRVDVKLHLLESAPRSLKNRARVRAYLGTAEIMARVVLLDREELEPGGDCYAQLILEDMAACVKNDRFVIRSYSPVRTIGGGKVINPAARKHKRFRSGVIKNLQVQEQGTPRELAEEFLNSQQALVAVDEIAPLAHFSKEEKEKILEELARENRVTPVPGEMDLYMAAPVYEKWAGQVQSLVEEYHDRYPLREGYPKEELRSKKFPRISAKQFQQLLQSMEQHGYIKVKPREITAPGFTPQPGGKQAELIKKIEQKYWAGNLQPPAWEEVCSQLQVGSSEGHEILQYLLRQGVLVKISDNILLHSTVLEEAKAKIRDYLQEHGELSVGGARDLLGTSRKYALPLLEYLDSWKFTKRVGDMRVPGRALE